MAIKEVMLPDGSKVEINEWLHWPQYSTVECAAALAINLRAFTYVVGQTVPRNGVTQRTATESDTNQVARTRMNHDEAFIAFSMTYEVFGLTTAVDGASPAGVAAPFPMIGGTNLHRLQRDIMLELFVGAHITKPMASAPLSWYGQGIGTPAWTSSQLVAAGVHVNYGTGGRVSPKNQRLWNLPIMISSDRAFYALVSSPVGAITDNTQNFRMRIWLDGLKQRPVA